MALANPYATPIANPYALPLANPYEGTSSPSIGDVVVDNRSEFNKGVQRGVGNTSAGIDATIGQLAEPFFPNFAKSKIDQALETTRLSAQNNPNKFPTYKNVHSIGDAWDYATGSLGEQVPNILATVGGGLAGRALSGTIGLGKLGSSVLGGGLSVFPQETGGIVQDIHSDPKAMANSTPWSRLGTSALAGAGASALEALPEAGILGKLLSPAAKMGKGVTGKLLGAGEYALKGAAGEAGTEGLQSVVEQAAPMSLNQDRKLNTNDIIDSAIKGAIGGAAFGGAAGTSAVVKDAFSLGNDHKFDGLVPDDIRAKGDAASLEWLAAGHEKAKSAVANRIDEIIADPKVSDSVKTKLSESKLNLDTQEGRDSAAKRIVSYENGKELGKTLYSITKPLINKISSNDLGGIGDQPKDMAGYQMKLFHMNELFDTFELDKSGEEWAGMKEALVNHDKSQEAKAAGNQVLNELNDVADTPAKKRAVNEYANRMGVKLTPSSFGIIEDALQKSVDNTQVGENKATGERTAQAAEKIQASFDIKNRIKNHFMESRSGMHMLQANVRSPEVVALAKRYDATTNIEQKNKIADKIKTAVAAQNATLSTEQTRRDQKIAALHREYQTSADKSAVLKKINALHDDENAGHMSEQFKNDRKTIIGLIGKEGYEKLASDLNKNAVKTGEGFARFDKAQENENAAEGDTTESVVRYEPTSTEDTIARIHAVDQMQSNYKDIDPNSNQGRLYRNIDMRDQQRQIDNVDEKLSAGMQHDDATVNKNDWEVDKSKFSQKMLTVTDKDGKSPTPDEHNTMLEALNDAATGNADIKTKDDGVDSTVTTTDKFGNVFTKPVYNKKPFIELNNHNEVKALFDKFGLDHKVLMAHARENYISRRRSDVGNEGEFHISDLPLLEIDEDQRILKETGGASKMTLLMTDDKNNTYHINAHVLTSAMAKMNKSVEVDKNQSYENRTKHMFMQAYSALMTQLGVTQKRADLGSKNIFMSPTKVFLKQTDKGFEEVDTNSVPAEIFAKGNIDGVVIPGWHVKNETRYYPKFDGGLVPARGLSKEEYANYSATGELKDSNGIEIPWIIHPATTIKNIGKLDPIKADDLLRESAKNEQPLEELRKSEIEMSLAELVERRDDAKSVLDWRKSTSHKIRRLNEAIFQKEQEQGGMTSEGNVDYMIPDYVFETPRINMDGSINASFTKGTISLPKYFESAQEAADWKEKGNEVEYDKQGRAMYPKFDRYIAGGPSLLASMDVRDPDGNSTYYGLGRFDQFGKSLRKAMRALSRIQGARNAPILDDFADAAKGPGAFFLHTSLEKLGSSLDGIKTELAAGVVQHKYVREIKENIMKESHRVFSDSKNSTKEVNRRCLVLAKQIDAMVDSIYSTAEIEPKLILTLKRMSEPKSAVSYNEDISADRSEVTDDQWRALTDLIKRDDAQEIQAFVDSNPHADLLEALAAYGKLVPPTEKAVAPEVGMSEQDTAVVEQSKADVKLDKEIAKTTAKLDRLQKLWGAKYGIENVSIEVSETVGGSTTRMGQYDHDTKTITLNRKLFNATDEVMGIFAHEYGHAILDVQLESITPELRSAYEAYKANAIATNDAAAGRGSVVQKKVARSGATLTDVTNKVGSEYFLSEQEWLADQFSNYALNPENVKAMGYDSSTKALFNKAIKALKEFFAKLGKDGYMGANYNTEKAFDDFLHSLEARNIEPKATAVEEQPPMADEHGNVVDKGEYGTGYKPNGGTVEDVHENIMGKLQNESLSVLKAHLVTKKESLAAWLAKGELSEAQALTAKAMRKEIKAIERAIAEKSRADFVEDRTKGSNKTVAQRIEDNKNTYFTEEELNEFKDEEVHNEAGHDAGVDGTANDDPAIRKYLQRILGNKVKVLVGQYPEFMSSYAKEGEDTHFVRLSNLVGLGTNKEGVDERLNMFQGFDPAGRASHSAMAGVAESLKGTEAYREMAKFAVQPHVMKQLNVLLANNPEALRQAKTSLSARLAYAFMFYESGQFTVTQPVAKNWFNSAINFIQSVFHMLSSDEKAMRMFTAIQQGKMANATQKKAEDFYKSLGLRSTMENFFANNRTAEALKDALWRMSTAQSTRATVSGDVSLQTLSDSLKKEKGTNEAGDKEGFVQARQRMMGEFLNQFGELTKKDEWTNKEIDALMVKIRMNAPVENQREQALRDGIKELFADIFEYMQEKGVERAVFNEGQPMQWEPLQARKDYRMPQVWNAAAMAANPEASIAFLQKLDLSEEAAREFVENINKTPMGVTEVRQSEYDVELTPAMMQLNDRQIYIPDSLQEEASMFLKNSMLEVMGSYIRSAVHRAEFADRFGNDGSVITKLLEKAEADGVATADEIADARLLVKAVEGTIGLDIDPRLKKFNNTVITAVNFIILGMSLFTSLADVAGIAVKTGNLKDSWHAFKVGVSALFGQLDKAQGYRLAVAIGSVDMTHQLDIVGNVYGGQYIDGWQSRANELLFKINGMTAWNNAMRVAATDIMDMWLLDNANNPDVLRAEGINPDNINWELEGNAFYQQEEVKQGLYRLVDEMILRPDATQRPAWGSDPHKALFWHLKQFTWSFNQMILLPALRKAKQGDLMPLYMVGSYVPMVMVSDFVRGLVQGGGEEPEWKKKLSMSQRVISGVNRSGVLGVAGMGLESMSGPAQGKPMAVSLLGPTVGIGYDETTALWDILTPSDADRHTAGEKTFNMIKRVLPFSNVYTNWDTFSVDEDAKPK